MRLALKITVSMGLLALLTGLVLSLTMRDLLGDKLQEQQRAWAQALVQSLRDVLAEDVINEHPIQIDTELRSLVDNNPAIEYAVLVGFNGRIVAHTFRDTVPRDLLATLLKPTPPEQDAFFRTPDRRHIMVVSYPLIEGLDAYLQLGINDTQTRLLLDSVNARLVLIFGIAFAFILLFVWLLGKTISRPLHSLVEQLRHYGQGRKLNFQTVPDSDPDIRLLRDSLLQAIADRARAFEALEQRERYLALTLDSIGDAVITTDARGIVTRLNPVAEQLTGWKRQGALGKAVQTVFHIVNAHTRNPVDNPVERVLETGLVVGLANHTVLVSRDGHEYQIADSGAPIRDETGRIIGVILVFRDVTDEYRLQQELRLHRDELERLVEERTREVQQQARILEQTHDAVIATDMDGYIVSWNKGAERLYGYSESEALGQPVSLLYAPEQHEFLQREISTLLKVKGEYEAEVRLRRKDGETLDIHLSLTLLYDEQGRPSGIVSYSLDIGPRKQIERELQQQHEALEAANAELKSFSYSVSHDLRAPLRAIDGFSQALLEDYTACLDETGKDYLQRVRKAAQRMSQLIDDMLMLSRTTTRDLNLQRIDLTRMAESILTELHQHEPERQVEWQVARGLEAEGDRQLVQIALTNLLDNAWKYSRKSAPARIEVGSSKDAGTTVFYVRDNGIGFDMEHADKLFGVFQRLHRQDEYEGTGVGLATVARIIKRHGGWIRAEAAPGEGATFFFTLTGGIGPDASGPV